MSASPTVLRSISGSGLLALAWVLGGCHGPSTDTLGVPPTGTPLTLSAARNQPPNSPLTVSGVMIEKCPEAGCWFVLEDSTGRVKVDTKTAGFVVVEIPLRRKMEVMGQWVTNGNEVILAASGLRY